MGIKFKRFLKGKRIDLSKNSDIPGPGNYKIPCSFGELPIYDKDDKKRIRYI